MAIDWGLPITLVIVLWIVGTSYKKKTGQPISELWKNAGQRKIEDTKEQFQRVYITRGIKQ